MRTGRPAIRYRRGAVVLLCLSGAAACSLWKDPHPCASVEEYQSARSVPPVKVPHGTDAPEASAELNVPDVAAPAQPLSENAACLQYPPNYFDKTVKNPSN